ncbi:extensin-like domain-containing protein [Stakelama saccharophila]|uniref:Extensin family protein n=1 Tax=Stakelama saccharophila TaxID=3075605 RepID=A0ABZ0B949_9SPHN|nr:extensin family protein [Stakelama sp. W311]WNO53946.1 extensin family protein [Stakelama sp. W311]
MKRVFVLASILLLSACIFGGGDSGTGPRRPGAPHSKPHLKAAKSGIPTDAETRQCYASLNRKRVEFRSLPDRGTPGSCSRIGTIQLLDIGTPVTNLGAMRCGLADRFVNWVRYGIRPAARQILGSDVVKIESFGTYSCRGIVGNGTASRLSEHAVADAVDIAAFDLADGRRISVLEGWNSDNQQVRAFLRVVHRSACKRFSTTLGPEYNSAHRNHFHIDMGGGHFCR